MTTEEALRWLQQVEGQLFRSPRPPEKAEKGDAWVAVVRAPRQGMQRGRLIVALGENMIEATEAASRQWHEIFASLGEVN